MKDWDVWLVAVVFIGILVGMSYWTAQPRVFELDGHKWIQQGSTLRVAPVHHPDCPCGKAGRP
jgi:hypothetical protein